MTTQNGTTKRVAIYCRVSTDQQTIENQRRELEAVAQRQGWAVVGILADEGISGRHGREKRPALDALLRGVARKDFDIVAAWSVDRLGRSLRHLLDFLGELKAKGVDLYLHQQGVDTSTPGGNALYQMLGVFAEFERAVIQERVRAGIRRARALGTKSGRRIGRPRSPVDVGRALELMASGRRSMRSVARTLGVSAATVSRALAGVAKPPTRAPKEVREMWHPGGLAEAAQQSSGFQPVDQTTSQAYGAHGQYQAVPIVSSSPFLRWSVDKHRDL